MPARPSTIRRRSGHGVFRQQAANVQKMIDSLASETGLPVYITEFDINYADDMQQLQAMQSLFTMFWNDANVKGITISGLRRRLDLGSQHRAHDERRHDASGHDLARGLPQNALTRPCGAHCLAEWYSADNNGQSNDWSL